MAAQGGCGAREVQTVDPSSYICKLDVDFIKQNYATFYLWDPQDDKSEQDYWM